MFPLGFPVLRFKQYQNGSDLSRMNMISRPSKLGIIENETLSTEQFCIEILKSYFFVSNLAKKIKLQIKILNNCIDSNFLHQSKLHNI